MPNSLGEVQDERDSSIFFFFQAEDGIRDYKVTGVQTCALPISRRYLLQGDIPMTAQTDPQGNAGVPAGLDQQESREWMDALSAVIDREGAEYAHKLIEDLLEHARQNSVDMPFSANTGYVNKIGRAHV